MKKGILKAVAVGAIAATMGTAGATIGIKFGNEKNEQLSQEIKDLQKELDDAKLNIGHTDEELEQAKEAVRKEEQAKTEETVNQAKEETANEYKTILNILTAKYKTEITRRGNSWEELGKFVSATDAPGIVYIDNATKEFKLIKKDGKYTNLGEFNGYYLFCSETENLGLFGISRKDLTEKIYANEGKYFRDVQPVGDKIVALCRIEGDGELSSVVELNEDGSITKLIDNENDIGMSGNSAYELGTNKLYYYSLDNQKYEIVEGVDVSIEYVTEMGSGMYLINNSQNKLAIYSTTHGYKSKEIQASFRSSIYASSEYLVFSADDSAVYKYTFEDNSLETLIEGVAIDTSYSIATEPTIGEGGLFRAENKETGKIDLYRIKFNGVTKLLENLDDVQVTAFFDCGVNLDITQNGETSVYQYDFKTESLTKAE